MKLGTQIKLSDGRFATVVYNSLIGVGAKLGLHNPSQEDFEGTDGNTVKDGMPDGFIWEPDILLRDPWSSCEQCGFKPEDCVGNEFEVIRIGLGI